MTEWLSSLSAGYADQIEMLLRLSAATIAGMVVGINREIHDKPIGMRTLGLVSLGSAIVILAGSVYEGIHFGQDAVSRVIQGIMTGLVRFLAPSSSWESASRSSEKTWRSQLINRSS